MFWAYPSTHTLTNSRQAFLSFIFANLRDAAAAAKSLQSCPTLCDHIDGSLPGSPIPVILLARTLESSHFHLQCMKVKSESEVDQSCWTLSDPMDCSLPGSSVHGILQARVLEWVAIAFSTWEMKWYLIVTSCLMSGYGKQFFLVTRHSYFFFFFF